MLNGFRYKFHGQRVDAMARIFWGEVLALKHMTQVGAAVAAHNLNTTAIGIRHTLYSTGYLVVKTRPAAVRFKLGI